LPSIKILEKGKKKKVKKSKNVDLEEE
jgi:hypothetical protein